MTATIDDQQKKEIRDAFDKLVNMSASTLTNWLKTEESKSVGQTKEVSKESIGHQSGKRIIDILHKKVGDLTENDYEHMQKVVGYIKRHSAQRPEHVADSDWAYSLKNWGHDPEK